MTNEIKEILDYVFSLAYGECFSDEREDIKKAEDYITNLQEENKRLKEENKHIFAKEELVDKIIELATDNIVKDNEIVRLNKIIDELEKCINKEKNRLIDIAESKGILIDKSLSERIDHKVGTLEYVLDKLKELKEEGKSQEIPLFEGTMEQLDNLTILKEEGKE